MFVAGIRRLDRVRGSGWLVCPRCGEHAVQDVVDEMRFLAVLFYRLAPVGRRRDLVCGRCGYRRPATAEELARLETRGRRIGRAWLVPIGLTPLLLIGLVAVVAGSTGGSAANQALSYRPQSAEPIAPLRFDGPSTWQYSADRQADPPVYVATDPAGRTSIAIRRVAAGGALRQLLAAHWADEVSINATGFPEAPCPAATTTIAGQHALRSEATFTSEGEVTRQIVVVLRHDGVGYVITFVAHGNDAISALPGVVAKVTSTLEFTADETPAPQASPSPGSDTIPTAAPSPTAATGQAGCSP